MTKIIDLGTERRRYGSLALALQDACDRLAANEVVTREVRDAVMRAVQVMNTPD